MLSGPTASYHSHGTLASSEKMSLNFSASALHYAWKVRNHKQSTAAPVVTRIRKEVKVVIIRIKVAAKAEKTRRNDHQIANMPMMKSVIVHRSRIRIITITTREEEAKKVERAVADRN